jgi:hypothetical protein
VSGRMRLSAPANPERTPEQAALEAVRLARSRKRGAHEALEVAQNRLIAAAVELDQGRTPEARQRRQGAREALGFAHDRFVAACTELGQAKRMLEEVREA